MSDLAFASALEQAELVRRGEVSSRELVDLYLRRIEEHDEELNSYVLVLGEEARGVADAKDEATASAGDAAQLPPFHGVPISIKELNFLVGHPATLSTQAMKDFVAPFDDEVVARLKRAGFVVLGKTNAPELGTVPWTEPDLHGPARNPWDLEHTPGGSSGGAAAALAAGLCPVAQGSDGGGSIRIPASNCGLYGLKPTRDRISNAPLFGDHAFGLVTNGTITRTVADAAATLDVMSGYVPGDPGMLPPPERPFADEVARDPGRLRVAVMTSSPVATPDPRVVTAVEEAADTLSDLGHDVFDTALEFPESGVQAFTRLWWALAASNPIPSESLEPYNQWMVSKGREMSAPAYLRAQFQLQMACRGLQSRFHDEFDVAITPVLAEPPVRIGAFDDLDSTETWERLRSYASYTPIVNATGQPAASLPLHWDDDTGLPIGVQLIGRFADEATVLRVSAQLETARPWAGRRPGGFA
jgi:amidase